jgi:SOS-response transcriptional repressor LexA
MTAITFNEFHRDVMLYIQKEVAATGLAPRISDVMKHCGVASKSRAHKIIDELVGLGHLGKVPNKTRGLVVLRPLPDRFEEAAKAACEAAGIGADKVPLVRDAIASTLTRAA